MDSRFRGNDKETEKRKEKETWIPAFAGMTKKQKKEKEWIPAFAGMTRGASTSQPIN